MADIVDPEWIKAHEALDLVRRVYGGNPPIGAAKALAKRAHAGLLRSRARLFVWEEQPSGRAKNVKETEWTDLPRKFWWAEGKPALSQDWVAGDFSTWIDERFHWRAFGVEFCGNDVEAMLPVPFAPVDTDDTKGGQPMEGHTAEGASLIPSDTQIAEKMQELIGMGMRRDVAAKVIRQVAGFEQVGNEHARRVVSGKLPVGRPKKGA